MSKLSKFIRIRASCFFRPSSSDAAAPVITMRAEAIFPSLEIEFQQIRPLQILPNQLVHMIHHYKSIMLSRKHSLTTSDVNILCGYMTLDQTRRAVLLMENDPLVQTVPIVGIWVNTSLLSSSDVEEGQDRSSSEVKPPSSPLSHLSHPTVYCCCLHFLHVAFNCLDSYDDSDTYESDDASRVKEVQLVDPTLGTFLLVSDG